MSDQPDATFVASYAAQLASAARADGFRLGRIAGAEDVDERERAAYDRGLAEGRRQRDAEYDVKLCGNGTTPPPVEMVYGYNVGLAEGRRQATEGSYTRGVDRGFAEAVEALRHGGERYDLWVAAQPYDADLANDEPSRQQLADYLEAVGPWEPAAAEHAFDGSSIVNPATGMPYRGSSGPEPYEPPDPLCVCGAPWLSDEGCLTQQPSWTPPPPYDGPSIEELLPAEQAEAEEGHRD